MINKEADASAMENDVENFQTQINVIHLELLENATELPILTSYKIPL